MYRPYVLSSAGAPPRLYAKQRSALRQLASSQNSDERVFIEKRLNRENPAEIEEEIPQGVRSNVVICAKTTYGDLNRLSEPDNHQLWNIANRITAEVARAIAAKTARCIEHTGRSAPNTNVKLCVHSCAKLWRLNANPPFKQLNLTEIARNWQEKRRGNAYHRFVLCTVLYCNEDSPEKIKEFSIRMNQSGGRSEALKNLPDGIEEVLKDFGEDMMGFGHDELKPWIDVDLEESKFYKNLGETEKERNEHLNELIQQQKDWRPQIFKCLQMALRDVRSYNFVSESGSPAIGRASVRHQLTKMI